MNEIEMSKVLDLICEEAEKLLIIEGLSKDAEQSIEKILSLARYKFDVIGEQ